MASRNEGENLVAAADSIPAHDITHLEHPTP